MKKVILLAIMLISVLQADKLGTIKTSGFLFKDSLSVYSFEDPDIKGIVCYVTEPIKSLSLEDPSDSAISCRKVSKISGTIRSKKRVFKNKKNLFFKTMYVDRIYDKKHNALLYVSYTKKLTGKNASNSISAVVLNN